MQITVVGIDLGKNICSLAGLDNSGQVVVRRRVRRENVLKLVTQLKPDIVAMEACGGATTSDAGCVTKASRCG